MPKVHSLIEPVDKWRGLAAYRALQNKVATSSVLSDHE
jgi:hypothetical protein